MPDSPSPTPIDEDPEVVIQRAVRAVQKLDDLQKEAAKARDEAEAAIRTALDWTTQRQIAERAGVRRSKVEWIIARDREYVKRRRKSPEVREPEPGLSAAEAAERMGFTEAYIRRLASPERDETTRLPSMKSPRTGYLRILGPGPGRTWDDLES